MTVPMTTSSPFRVALIGGAESGKTTYMGRLWLQLEEPLLDSVLVRRDTLESFSDVNALIEPLINGRYPQRTKGERHALHLPLEYRNDSDRREVNLFLPDYNGEEVEGLYKRRGLQWNGEWEKQASASAWLIFVRPTNFRILPMLPVIKDAPTAATMMSAQEIFHTPDLKNQESWQRHPGNQEAVQIPTAVNLVEVLQFLRDARGLRIGQRPRSGELRVGVVLSCWDATPQHADGKVGPLDYFRTHLPLLDDFLWGNFDPDDIRVFALSSTGRDLDSDESFRASYEAEKSGKVWIQEESGGKIFELEDLSLPVAWGFGGDHIPALRKLSR